MGEKTSTQSLRMEVKLSVEELTKMVEEYVRQYVVGGRLLGVSWDYDHAGESFEGCTVTFEMDRLVKIE